VDGLDEVERALLDAIARGDHDARRVLADHWLDGADPARGELVQLQCSGVAADLLIAAHGARWRRDAIAAGFAAPALPFDRGFAPSLVVTPDEALGGSADTFRLSPRHYVVDRVLHESTHMTVAEAHAITATGRFGRFAIKHPHHWSEDTLGMLERERFVLERWRGIAGVSQLVDVAVIQRRAGWSESGPALVLAWAGDSVESLLHDARASAIAPGEAVAISIGVQVCDVVARLRAVQLRYAGISPRHVLVDADGRVTLVDGHCARPTPDAAFTLPGIDPANMVTT
jgi:hypothetical protein